MNGDKKNTFTTIKRQNQCWTKSNYGHAWHKVGKKTDRKAGTGFLKMTMNL
jgi:hypothetical protein